MSLTITSVYMWFTLMLAISSVWLVWFLYRPLKPNDIDLEESNVALGKQKQAELEQDLQRELIDETVYEQAKEEIAQVLAVEMMQTVTVVETQKPTPIWLTALIVVILSIASLGVYQAITPQSITAQNTTLQAGKVPALAQSIINIRKRLAQEPKDSKAWRILGLALFESDKLAESLEAYERSYQLNPKDEIMLIEYASTLAQSQGNQFNGRVSTLVREALEINPNAPDALYLAGWVAVNAQKLGLAQQLWQRSLSLLPEGQSDRVILQRMLERLSQAQVDKTKEETEPSTPMTSVQHQVVITVKLSEHLRQAEFSNHYLMIYVKAARGRPMPIAIQKIKLKDFTSVVTLTDANSVMPTSKLSQASKVLAVVRLSKSGSAMRQVGDIEVVSQVINVKNNPNIDLELK
ncbi:Cytochrome c heme lyase subunit CcmH [hydrothermal vent metagenome]|uniref:Cytochrome c heme lyase subunit CcmH n=1 Tax=hydrothermal vent metagenome TaxID=652676 RepID=A0A1W1E4E8_9ZZZZ